MTHLVSKVFRRALLPALLLLLPLAASAFATSAAPAGIAPAGRPGTGGDGLQNHGEKAPDVVFQAGEGESKPKTASAVKVGSVSISLSSAPFLSVGSGDQIVREFVVRNDGDAPADFTVVMHYNIGWRAEYVRSVTTSRRIPAHSVQTVSVFAPSYMEPDSENITVANPLIYVNGKQVFQLPTGIFDAGEADRYYYAMPSSFTTAEPVMRGFIKDLLFGGTSGYRNIQCGFSNSDTVQWPAIPQFYQAKGVLFRKTNDKFTPDAERAIRDAVMLGATEFLFIPRGEQRPEWAPAPAIPGRPVVVPRGFGRTIVLDERYIFNPAQEEVENALKKPYSGKSDAELEAAMRVNRQTLDYLASEHLFIGNPAELFQLLPCVEVPNLSFFVVILALLAYIIVVGPVNYFYLVKRKKSVLLLLFTVPVISLVFVGIVILFVTFFEGWFSRASAVGVTFLDQQESMGYTRAAVNLYAPLPVRSLVFDAADTVSFARANNVNVSLGRDQVVTGANRARIPLVYGVSRAEKHLEQLRVSRNTAGTITVMNGLGAPVKILAMKTPDGECWLPSEAMVQPGVSAELKPSGGEGGDVNAQKVLLNDGSHGSLAPGRNQLFYTLCTYLYENTSDDSSHQGNTARGNRRNNYRYDMNPDQTKQAVDLAMEQNSLSPLADLLSPGMYIAETDRPLFYTPGCSPLSFRARHLVVGTFTLQESAHEN